ncbi:MAG TPA: hypothetical protein VNS99_05215 [Gaiellales bacterium]|nr:hypothetical protein [Gaiellales bacterium]
MIAPLSTGASHTVLGLAGAAVGMLVVWIAGCALAPARPPAERLAWGVVTMLAVAWSTLWQPLLGVSWLGHRTLMAVIVVVCTIVVGARTRAWRTAPDVRRPVALVAAVALAVSVLPLVWGPSAVAPISDMQFHEGWIRQLVGGLPEPSGVYAHVPNSYPWLYHALAAWLELLPGGMVEVYWALQVFAVGSLALGTWLLARELGLREAPATWAVGFASLAGGVGWIWVHEPVAVVSSSRYGLVHGDFLVGPAVTPALANMPAILPRDLALALFPLTVWFALRAIAGRRMRDVAAAGALTGCLLLIGPVAAVVAVLVCGPVALRRRIPVGHAAAAVAVAAVVVAPWLGRVALNYVRLGGLSPHQPLPSVTASQALVAMGVVLPIGLIGVVWMLRTRPPDVDLGALVPLVAVPAVLCLLAGLLPGHSLAGVAPVVKLQRYLPFFVLALAMPAGWAADAVLARMSRRRAVVLATALIAAAGASTVLTSIGLAGDFRSAEPRGLHCRGGAPMGAGDVVAVAGMRPQPTLVVDSSVFRSTGAWLFHWVPPAQLRYRDVFSTIKGQGERAAETRGIARGRVPAGIDWVMLPGAAPGRSLVKVTSCRAGGLDHSVDVQVYRPRSSG